MPVEISSTKELGGLNLNAFPPPTTCSAGDKGVYRGWKPRWSKIMNSAQPIIQEMCANLQRHGSQPCGMFKSDFTRRVNEILQDVGPNLTKWGGWISDRLRNEGDTWDMIQPTARGTKLRITWYAIMAVEALVKGEEEKIPLLLAKQQKAVQELQSGAYSRLEYTYPE
jgi:hypothetical protein